MRIGNEFMASFVLAMLFSSALMAQEAPAVEQPKAEKPAVEKPAAENSSTEVKADDKKADDKKPEEKKPAEAKPAEASGPKPKTVVEHLDNPSGICVHGETGHVFITSNQGVFRYVPGKPNKIYLEVDGFSTDEYGKGPKYKIGPLGCALWGTDRLVIADGSKLDGEEVCRVFKIEDKAPAKPRKEADAEFTLGPIGPQEKSPKGEGNYYGVLVHENAIWVTANGDDTKGWVAKSVITEGKPGSLEPSLATKEKVNVDAPVAITVTPDKKQLVIGQMGEVNVAGDSLLTMYDPATGELLKSYKTGLSDITGLAYSPTGKLYATDFAWSNPVDGGLFELTIEGEEVKATKILSLDRPTSLAFDKDGALLITVFGLGLPAGDKPSGAVVKLPKGL